MATLNALDLGPLSGFGWRRRLAVGTGSTAPSVGNTTLAAEVQRDATSGTFPNGSNSYALDTNTNVWRATSLVTRLVTMTADRNLTEFGFAQNTTGDIVIRELLRDGGGNPIAVSLLNGRTLRLDHTLTIEIPAPAAGHTATINIEEYDAGNNLVSSTPYQIVYGLMSRELTNNYEGIGALFTSIWSPSSNITHSSTTGGGIYPSTQTTYSRQWTFQSTIGFNGDALPAYVAGSFQRPKRCTVPTGSFNQQWNQYMMMQGTAGNQNGGLYVKFTSPTAYTKKSTDTLRVGLISSWARA